MNNYASGFAVVVIALAAGCTRTEHPDRTECPEYPDRTGCLSTESPKPLNPSPLFGYPESHAVQVNFGGGTHAASLSANGELMIPFVDKAGIQTTVFYKGGRGLAKEVASFQGGGLVLGTEKELRRELAPPAVDGAPLIDVEPFRFKFKLQLARVVQWGPGGLRWSCHDLRAACGGVTANLPPDIDQAIRKFTPRDEAQIEDPGVSAVKRLLIIDCDPPRKTCSAGQECLKVEGEEFRCCADEKNECVIKTATEAGSGDPPPTGR